MPGSVVYVLPEVPAHIDDGPVRDGSGKGFTATGKEAGVVAVQPNVFA
jgi:hypothetical protein